MVYIALVPGLWFATTRVFAEGAWWGKKKEGRTETRDESV